MSNFQEASQSLPGGFTAIYSLSGENGTLSLRVVDSKGIIIGAGADSYANRNELLLKVSGQIADDFREVQQDAERVQTEINQLTAIINNPNANPQDKAVAQASLTDAKQRKANLDKVASDLRNANLQFGSQFSTIANDLNTAAKKANTPAVTPTVPANTAPATITPEPKNTNTLTGTADGDKGSPTTNTTGAAPTKPVTSANQPANAASTPSTVGTPTDSSTPAGSPTNPDIEDFADLDETILPGRRIKNPLGYLASYNYQISLYMISPSAYEAFLKDGRRDINIFQNSDLDISGNDQTAAKKSNGGAVLLAQSGGISRNAGDVRAPSFEYDYYIDNVQMNHAMSQAAEDSTVITSDIKFNLIEPYGFSFINNLRRANDIIKQDTGEGPSNTAEAGKQFFIMGIRFFGWDQTGRQVTGNEIIDGTTLDPNASSSGALFQTFYDFVIKSIKFKIDGKSVVYNIEGASVNGDKGSNTTKGMVPENKEVYGQSVQDALTGSKGLLPILNKVQRDLVKNKSVSVPVTYRVEWVGDAIEIAQSKLVSDADTKKDRQAASGAKTTTQVNASNEVKAAPNKNLKKVAVGNVPVVQAIENIIMQSKFVRDALKYSYTDKEENDPNTDDTNKVDPGKEKYFKWFTINPRIGNIKWDPKTKDWVYDITYVIQTCLVPEIDNPYISKKTKYYGPHKRYDYWYTGQNTEVLAYEQVLDTAYFNTVLTGSADPSNKDTSSSPTGPNMKGGGDSTGSGNSPSQDAQNSVRTTLYDPSGQASAKITILGDPDYIAPSTQAAVNKAYNRFYGSDGYTVNPNGGQVFVEIDFKEAVDYSSSTIDIPYGDTGGIYGQGGTLAINDSISFWGPDYTSKKENLDEASQIKGLRYQLNTVTSIFAGGTFKQVLDGKMIPPGKKDSDNTSTEPSSTPQTSGGSPSNKNTTTNDGLKTDQPAPVNNQGTGQTAAKPVTPTTGQDDDNPNKPGA